MGIALEYIIIIPFDNCVDSRHVHVQWHVTAVTQMWPTFHNGHLGFQPEQQKRSYILSNPKGPKEITFICQRTSFVYIFA